MADILQTSLSSEFYSIKKWIAINISLGFVPEGPIDNTVMNRVAL